MKASEFLAQHPNLTPAQLEQAVLATPLLVVPWPMTNVTVQGGGHTVTFFASNDVLSIGEYDDLLRVPLSGHGMDAVAKSLGCGLPTTKMSDLIWQAAQRRLVPVTGGEVGITIGGADQMSVRAAVAHSRRVDEQLAQLPPGGLVAGHKKDVVVTNRLLDSDPHGVGGSVAIYGWHRLSGTPIQPLSLVHADPAPGTYEDYSHGARLIGDDCVLDGQRVSLDAVLSDPQLAPLLSYEGVLRALRYPPRLTAKPAPKPPTASPTPTLRLGSRGASVQRWAHVLLLTGASGVVEGQEVFGDQMLFATRWFQRAYQLEADGVVGPKTWAMGLRAEQAGGRASPTQPAPPPAAAGDVEGVPFVKARNYYAADDDRPADLIVLHSMEIAEKGDTAEACARMFATTDRDASAHFCVDCDSVVQCVRERDAAYAAPGTNRAGTHRVGVHVEHAGFARQTPGDWADAYSTAMLALSAKLVADVARRHSIPLTFVDAEALLAGGARGVTTHAEVSKACRLANQRKLTSSPFYNAADPSRPRTDHTDPGIGFQIEEYLAAVRAEANAV